MRLATPTQAVEMLLRALYDGAVPDGSRRSMTMRGDRGVENSLGVEAQPGTIRRGYQPWVSVRHPLST